MTMLTGGEKGNVLPMQINSDGVFVQQAKSSPKAKGKIRKNVTVALLAILVLLLVVLVFLNLFGVFTIWQMITSTSNSTSTPTTTTRARKSPTTTTTKSTTTTGTPKEVVIKRPSYAMQLMEENIGRSKDPCHDFYAFACEGVMNSRVNNRIERVRQKYDDFLSNLKVRRQINRKSLKYFQEQFNQCYSFDSSCRETTVKNFANVLGLAMMDEFNLWNLTNSIVNNTKKAFSELIEQNHYMTINGKSRAIHLIKMTDFHIGLPKDFASWDVLDRIYEYGFNNATDGKPNFTQIDDWYLEIFGRKPN